MAILKIAKMGHPVLRQVAKPVPEESINSPKIQSLIKDMAKTMVEYDGRGLAAPQVHESVRIMVVIWDFDEDKDPYLLTLINPELEILTDETSAFWEGCLSLPGLQGLVARPNRLSIKGFDEKG